MNFSLCLPLYEVWEHISSDVMTDHGKMQSHSPHLFRPPPPPILGLDINISMYRGGPYLMNSYHNNIISMHNIHTYIIKNIRWGRHFRSLFFDTLFPLRISPTKVQSEIAHARRIFRFFCRQEQLSF
jgi:hypothetical protein